MMRRTIVATTLLAVTGLAHAAEPIQVIEPATITNPEMVELGKKLFFEPRLSKSGFLSCNSCHNLSLGGVDILPTSIGHNWQEGPINAPTVLNAKYMLAQFWDGRAATLQEQAAGPIANPKEMALEHELALDVLRAIPGYQAEFSEVFGDKGITLDTVTEAIATFEETLVTPNSRFDQYLNGDKAALNAAEQEGYVLFKSKGCAACHNGPAVGGTMYQKMGLMQPFVTSNPAQGRVDVTGKEHDRMVFKVPTLRNIELTYPYFHDGSTYDLKEAVIVMQRVQLGQELTDQEADRITDFLKTLTGEQPQITLPILPPSVAGTPKPQPFAK
ncbi:cytochrome-c peroxidase [Halomonas denitrificans]|nr:cytochrome-c peroxidase [Halomonas denitrificans]